jgi:CSLREA domain-containing protein
MKEECVTDQTRLNRGCHLYTKEAKCERMGIDDSFGILMKMLISLIFVLAFSGMTLGESLGLKETQLSLAETFTVTKTIDSNDGACDADCSLREAIIAANTNVGADTVILPSGVYSLTLTGMDEDAAATGDLDITDDLNIIGSGTLSSIIDGGAIDRVFHVVGKVNVEISQMTIRNGKSEWSADADGAGLLNSSGNLVLSNSVVENNESDSGSGGICNGSGTTKLIYSTIRDNYGYGVGGIANGSGAITITNSIVVGNTSMGGGGGLSNGSGTVMLSNSTIISNGTGSLDPVGGGISNCGGGAVELINSTVSNNDSYAGTGGIHNLAYWPICDSGHITITNTIVAYNANGNCSGSITSMGHNLDTENSCSFDEYGDLSNTDPLLVSLDDNGGPTLTQALKVGSPAIDSGDNTVCPATDQRGFIRDLSCDIGAYEFDSSPPTPTPTPTHTPAPTPTHTPTPTPTSSPNSDYFEPDDTCAEASAIPTDGTVQPHTFHDQADADWVTFEANADTTYLIEAQIPAGSPADVILELYDQCDTLPEETQDYTFTPGARLEFTTPVSGSYYLKLLSHDATAYGPDVAYQLSVRALAAEPTPGALVLVAGKIRPNDPLQDNIYHVTGAVRQLFLAHDYDDDRIAYLAPDTSQAGVDYLVSADTLEQVITTWAPDKVGPDRPFTLYMMDHGDYDQFYLDKPRGEWVTPQEIDAWLATLEAVAPGVTVNIIVEACKSGSFIDLTHSVSAPGRVVIASTGAWRIAWATDEGAVFSDHFIAGLDQGESLFGAFQTARWATEAAHAQTPWLDDDGDGVANGALDGTEAARRGFSFAGTLAADEWPPYIVAATGPTEIAQGNGVLQAEVRDDEAVHRVWAVIYPPSYEPPTSGVEMPQENLPTLVLQEQGTDVYGATYTGFDEIGTYRVVIHAEDNDRREGRPLALEVRAGWEVYLPLVLRSP